jgi:hypothetical protein
LGKRLKKIREDKKNICLGRKGKRRGRRKKDEIFRMSTLFSLSTYIHTHIHKA